MTAQEAITPTQPPPSDGGDYNIVLNIWQVVLGIITLIAAGGIIGILGIARFAKGLREDAVTIKAIEELANSVHKDVLKTIHEISIAGRAVMELVEEATDGIPASEKPTDWTEENAITFLQNRQYQVFAPPFQETVDPNDLGDSTPNG